MADDLDRDDRTTPEPDAPDRGPDRGPGGGLRADVVREAAAYVDTWWAFRRRHHRVPGVQAAIGWGGELVLDTAHGWADVATQTPLRTDHVFRVASHSKTFTATVLWQLQEQGVLRLDDPLLTWLPWLGGVAPAVGALTLRSLLSHTSGLTRDGQDGDHWQLRQPFHDEAGLRRLLPAAVVTEPEVRFKYSNVGYALLGLVVAAATGTTWAQAVRDRVVDPLGLTATSPDLPAGSALADRVATGYSSLAYADERVPIEQVPTAAMAAATGVCSTASDLVRYFSAHARGDERLLRPLSQRGMQHAGWDTGAAAGDGYGLGVGVSEVGGRPLVGHGGGWPGHITRTLLDPADGLVVSVLTNAIDGPAAELATGAVHLLDLAGRGAGGEAARRTDREVAAAFTGRWATLWGVQDVALLGGRLVLLNPSAADPTAAVTELEVVDDDTLVAVSGPGYGSVGERLRATRDDDGTVRTLRTGSGMTTWRLADLALPERVGPGSL